MNKTPLVWPAFATDPAAPLTQWTRGLGESQAWTAGQLLKGQQQQLKALARWAYESTPYFRNPRWREPLKRVAASADTHAFADAWQQVPVLTKAELRLHGTRVHAQGLPASERKVETLRTTGSTGIPVEIRRNPTARAMWLALTLREVYWLNRDMKGRLGIARYLPPERRQETGETFPTWGPPYFPIHVTGPRAVIHVGHALDVIGRWLDAHPPNVLLTYPTVLAGLMDLRGALGPPPGLADVSLISEPVSPDLVERLATEWRVRTTQCYSAVDGGYLALQCDRGRLHVQAEAVYLELLREDGSPCAPGQTGRVVITPLHNLATPLRYAIGDYAVAGERCDCGREHAVIDRVLGRERNLVRRPDGTSGWAGLRDVVKIDAVLQGQFVQTRLDQVELRVKLSRPLDTDLREQLVRTVRRTLAYPFEVDIVQVDSIERGPGGKFEEFVSRLDR